MGSRKQWAADLKKRFEDIGWRVEWANNGHHKVTTHDGNTFGMASSPSDANAERVVIRQANKYGFHKREQMYALKRERDRLARLSEDQAEGIDEGDSMKVQRATRVGQLGYIGEVAIAEIGPAMITTPQTPKGGSPMVHGEKVTLVDGTVRYRCTYRTDSGPCFRDFDKVGSVSSHLKVHTAKWQEKYPSKTEKETTVTTPKTTKKTTPKTAEPGVIAKLTELLDFAEAVGDDLGAVTDAFETFKKDLHKLVQELPDYVTDADTREKVQKYEQLRELLK